MFDLLSRMSNFFNHGSPKFRRGVLILSIATCSFVGFHVLMSDFGSQKHVFTPIQKYLTEKLDAFYAVKHDELFVEKTMSSSASDRPLISMRRVDVEKKWLYGGNERPTFHCRLANALLLPLNSPYYFNYRWQRGLDQIALTIKTGIVEYPQVICEKCIIENFIKSSLISTW